jgi:CheY-like chemotaxis protein
MPDGGEIKAMARNISVTKRSTLPLSKGNYVEIIIEDKGVGIPKEHLDRIFDPYFSTKQKGSGLGLTTAYSIIKNHGGYITVDSKLGVGTTLSIYLRATKERIPKRKQEVTQPPSLGIKRILVMDDSEIVRRSLSDSIQDIGYEAEFAHEGSEAVELYSQAKDSGQPFDAVLLDLTVPGGMGGKETIERLLKIDPNVKAIVTSGYSTDQVMANYKMYGFSDVLVKPYGIEELEKLLFQILTETKK